ncbi:PREDICTED: uncharacterized protein LOC108776057 [Cyphomyrmex costatus]|uniref:uncharacterized protein LOC108776057 n=1 Tax=Cyphomyrmex costatus TaxID=456900 RepID=UPI00085233CF|nr:PREDICTED: uncharacterized protein LOC108776057 [Cyphomyrmex costatus]
MLVLSVHKTMKVCSKNQFSEFLALDNNELGIPEDACLPGTNTKFPHYLIADEAFPLKKYIMRPYPGCNLTNRQKIFNYRLSQARRTIENSCGILASRWRIFRTTIIADADTAEWIVCAALCLHNYLRTLELADNSENATYCPTNYADILRPLYTANNTDLT